MDEGPDYFFAPTIEIAQLQLKNNRKTIVPFGIYQHLVPVAHCWPLVDVHNLLSVAKKSTVFVEASLNDLTGKTIAALKQFTSLVIVAKSENRNTLAELRAFVWKLQGNGINFPVVLQRHYSHTTAEDLQVAIGADLGALFLDGMADGVFAVDNLIDEKTLLSAQYGLLQASRVRFSKTEYISCPGCGRTLFGLQEITESIKQRTAHLKGLKIGIMGCIVNGIGEMADADYGYVGSGPGKVSLFKQKELVKRNIPTTEALEELISLIKENGDWVEP
jgi:(E)-4-hydroxy-3-methylbut-2-enyl-diphosphate synthase